MPTMTRSLCPCGGIKTAGVCGRCGAKAKQQSQSTKDRGYGGAWRRTSERLRRRQPFCVLCWHRGRTALCGDVHHITKVKDAPHLRLDPDNTLNVCTKPCHAELDSLYESDRLAYDLLMSELRKVRDELLR